MQPVYQFYFSDFNFNFSDSVQYRKRKRKRSRKTRIPIISIFKLLQRRKKVNFKIFPFSHISLVCVFLKKYIYWEECIIFAFQFGKVYYLCIFWLKITFLCRIQKRSVSLESIKKNCLEPTNLSANSFLCEPSPYI